MTQAMTKRVPCQVRSKTESPCPHRAVVEIRGIPFCETCAREQEAYFAIGELTQGPQAPSSETLGKTLGEMMDVAWLQPVVVMSKPARAIRRARFVLPRFLRA